MTRGRKTETQKNKGKHLVQAGVKQSVPEGEGNLTNVPDGNQEKERKHGLRGVGLQT